MQWLQSVTGAFLKVLDLLKELINTPCNAECVAAWPMMQLTTKMFLEVISITMASKDDILVHEYV